MSVIAKLEPKKALYEDQAIHFHIQKPRKVHGVLWFNRNFMKLTRTLFVRKKTNITTFNNSSFQSYPLPPLWRVPDADESNVLRSMCVSLAGYVLAQKLILDNF